MNRGIFLKILFILYLSTLLFSFILFRFKTGKMTSPSVSLPAPTQQNEFTPTSAPFQELTIPYLQNRPYFSSLGTLQKLSENGSYTSFLTSFDSDGFKVNGLLTKPVGTPPPAGWPAIIFLHGYIPPKQYKTTENYADYVNYLARNGFVVFKIDLRGNGNSEGMASGAYYSGDYIIDTLNAIAALSTSGFVDPQKIGLWGHSMAGNIVMRSLAARPNIRAAVIWAGAVYTYEDMQKYGIDDNSYQPPPTTAARSRDRQRLRELYGDFDPDSSFWKTVAVTDYLKNLKGAIQVNHAVDDPVVDIGYSRDLMKLLDATSVPHELMEYSSGGHNISGPNFTKAMENTVEFFKKHL